MNDNILEQVKLSKQINILAYYQVKKIPIDNKLVKVVAGYFSLVQEYHIGIITLLENQMYSGSFALIRPLVDGCIRGLWILKCGTSNDVEKLLIDEFKFDNLRKLTQDIDKSSGNDLLENQYDIFFPALHDLTHGSTRQILRRFNNNMIKANFTEKDLHQAIIVANSFLLIMLQYFIEDRLQNKIPKEIIDLMYKVKQM